jgi:hypothetical protein
VSGDVVAGAAQRVRCGSNGGLKATADGTFALTNGADTANSGALTLGSLLVSATAMPPAALLAAVIASLLPLTSGCSSGVVRRRSRPRKVPSTPTLTCGWVYVDGWEAFAFNDAVDNKAVAFAICLCGTWGFRRIFRVTSIAPPKVKMTGDDASA